MTKHTNFLSIYAVVFFALISVPCLGQQRISDESERASVAPVLSAVTINYLGAQVIQERAIGRQVTFLYGLGAHYSFYSNASSWPPPFIGTRFINERDKFFGFVYSSSAITPYLLAELRLYTNLEQRAMRGPRNAAANAANYLALVTEIPVNTGRLIEVDNLALAYPVGVKYGARRVLGNHLYAEGSFGAFLKISSTMAAINPRLDFAIGWHL